MRDAFIKAIEEVAEQDQSFILITADLGFGIFDNFCKKYPDRFINVGIAEQNMIGVASGLAKASKKVLAYSIGNFPTLRCLEQIRNCAAYHELDLTIVASGGGFTYGALGMSHHATEDLGIMRSLPKVISVAPATPSETYFLTKQLIYTPGVGYLRLEKEGGTDVTEINQDNIEIGKAVFINVEPVNDAVIISIGGVFKEAQKAQRKLAAKGLKVSLVSMHTLKPIDHNAIEILSNKTKHLITLEEHNKYGGLASAVAEIICEKQLNVKLHTMHINDEYSSIVGDQTYLRTINKLDSNSISKKIEAILKRQFEDIHIC